MLSVINIALLSVALLGAKAAAQNAADPSPRPASPSSHLREVNPRIGTSGPGQTFPAIGPPFAMTYWTPETRSGEVKCIAPYYDQDRQFTGIRGTHFISGSCMHDYGSFTVQPESGKLRLSPAARGVSFEHADESMSPAEYRLTLPKQGIDLRATGTLRSGLMSFTFHHSADAWVVVQNNAWSEGGVTTVDTPHNELSGSNPVARLYAGSGKPAGFSGYFVIQFDHPFAEAGTWAGDMKYSQTSQPSLGPSTPTGAYVRFAVRPGETVHARIGTSFVSIDEARRNLAAEIHGWDDTAIAQATAQSWNHVLNSIDIPPDAASASQRTVFYTALYHAFLHPRTFSDANGSYPRFAGGQQVMHAAGFTDYDDFSVWDTFRAVHPLYTLLAPDREVDMVRSLIAKGEQGGYLPIFPAWNSYTSEMVGDHAIAIIYDAYAKGLRGFDVEAAYRLARHNAFDVPDAAASSDGRGRRGLASYLANGYIPLEDPVADAFPPHQNEQVSRTLAYAYDDALLGRFAADLHHDADAAILKARGGNWRKVLDPATGYVRGRHLDGTWATPFDPNTGYPWLTEATAAQETFFVPQDIPGLMQALGGPQAFSAKLDRLFADHGYDQGNEPSHHIAYLYDFAGEPAKAQQHIHELFADYTDRPDGLIGNDDAGQMSAWFVFSALGFYPVSPGDPRYFFGTPLFRSADVHLPHATLHLRTKNWAPDHPYVTAITLNGMPLDRPWIRHDELLPGGELVFTLSATPASAAKSAPLR